VSKPATKGLLNEVWAALAGTETDASTKSVFRQMYEIEVSACQLDELIASEADWERREDELRNVEMMLDLHPPGTPGHAEAQRRADELDEILSKSPPEKPIKPGEMAIRGLLKLKYSVFQLLFMVFFRLMIVVANVAAVIALIYFLPTIVNWLF
jgi:hypothetical protein